MYSWYYLRPHKTFFLIRKKHVRNSCQEDFLRLSYGLMNCDCTGQRIALKQNDIGRARRGATNDKRDRITKVQQLFFSNGYTNISSMPLNTWLLVTWNLTGSKWKEIPPPQMKISMQNCHIEVFLKYQKDSCVEDDIYDAYTSREVHWPKDFQSHRANFGPIQKVIVLDD